MVNIFCWYIPNKIVANEPSRDRYGYLNFISIFLVMITILALEGTCSPYRINFFTFSKNMLYNREAPLKYVQSATYFYVHQGRL